MPCGRRIRWLINSIQSLGLSPCRAGPQLDAIARKARQSGLIIVSQAIGIGAAIENLLLIWAATEAEERTGRLGFVPI